MNSIPLEEMSINKAGVSPVAGGVNTDWDKAQLSIGGYSNAENVRLHGPGFRLRPGLTRHHTTDLGEVYSMFSYKQGTDFFAQLSNGDVYAATDAPPGTTVGAFGTVVLDESGLNDSSTGTIVNGSWSTFREHIVFSEGKIQHTVRPATTGKPLTVVFLASTTVQRIMESGVDFTFDVVDPGSIKASDTFTFTVANEDSVYICTEFPATHFTFDLNVVTTGTCSFTFQFHDGDGWDTQTTGVTDGTIGWSKDETFIATMAGRATDGTERPTVMFGQSGYWYRFELVSDNATETVSFQSIAYTGDFRLLENVMENLPDYIVEAQVETAAGEFETYAASTISIGDLVAGDYIYFAVTAPIWAIYAEVGATPNVTASTAIDDLDVWTGVDWTAVTDVEDGTTGLSNTGYISWDRTGALQPRVRQFNANKNNMYWYRMNFDDAISADVIIALSALYYYDINELGRAGNTSAVWKERGCYTFSYFPRDIYVSKLSRANILNGSDSAVLSPGDGRYNATTAMLSFHNELMVFQEEKGSTGGCITMFEGYSPETFGRLVLSTRLGSFSQTSVCIIDGSTQVTRTTDVTQITVGFISKYGVYITDGRTVKKISDEIDDIFDPEKANYIKASSPSSHWIAYDRNGNCLRLGIETTTGSGYANIFPVYHLNDGFWTYDVYPVHSPTAFVEVTAASGNVDSLQYVAAIGASASDLIYRCQGAMDRDESESGTFAAVQGKLRLEFSNGGNQLRIDELVLRSESKADYQLTKNVYESGVIDSDETETYTMVDDNASSSVYRERILERIAYDYQFSIELLWKNVANPASWGASPVLYDFIYQIEGSTGVD